MHHPTLTYWALMLTALGLAPGAAHLLELPVKLQYDPSFYAAVTSTLYAWFGMAGGAVQVAAAVTVAVLAFRLRHQRREPGFRLTVLAAVGLALSLAIWGSAVAPVNAAWAEAGAPGTESFVDAYARLRLRWEMGHVGAFVSWFAGWCALAGAAVRRGSAHG